MATLAVALDFADAASALELAQTIRPCRPWLKVGLELFTSAGPDIVRRLKNMDFAVFLDLKFYDIPNTVASAVRAAGRLNVDMLTLHLQGGQRMCEAALAALPGKERPLLAGVTALTSFAAGEMPGIPAEPSAYGRELAACAAQWGIPAIVCSGHEAAAIRQQFPALRLVCPGIRPAGSPGQDQRRIMTPALAVASGADFIVVGRPITQAPDPLAATSAILTEMRTVALKSAG